MTHAPALRAGPAAFLRVVELNAGLGPRAEARGRARALGRIAAGVAEALEAPAAEQLARLPARIGAEMEAFGWLWNGFYVLRPDGQLHVGPVHGPPVCATLEAHGGLFSSGMCFDALHLNQTLAAPAVADWPGYVSCDKTSGLATVSGIVCPVRDAGGRPFAVWDLDAAQPVEPADVRFCDVLFSSLARFVPLSPADFA